MQRREFLQMLGLLSGAAMLSSCGSDTGQKELISYLVPPEEGIIPGEERWRPSTCTECPAHCGLLVRLRENRPVKLEGLPGHPINRGALCARGQAALWRLYHPERLKTPLQRDGSGRLQPVSWPQALSRIAEALQDARRTGRRSAFLSGRTTGALNRIIEQCCTSLEMERLPEFEPFSHAALRRCYGLLFDRADLPLYDIEQADLLLTVGADILETFVSPVEQTGQYTRGRQRNGLPWMHVEPHLSLTGVNAARRLVVHPGTEPHLLSWLLRKIAASERYRGRWPSVLDGLLPAQNSAATAAATGLTAGQLEELAAGFIGARKPLLIVGGLATAHGGAWAVALLGTLIQWLTALPWGGLDFSAAANYAGVGSLLDLENLARRLSENRVGVLLVSRCNPVRHAPPALDLAGAFGKARLKVGLADLPDETTELMDLVLPLSHGLESWGDAEPRRGVRSLLQPLLPPRHDTLSEGDFLLRLQEAATGPKSAASWREFLAAEWRRNFNGTQLRQLVEEGFLLTGEKARPPVLAEKRAAEALRKLRWPAPLEKPAAAIAPSIRTHDGRSRSLPLLQEIPDPLTTISYGDWVSVAPATASGQHLKDCDQVRLDNGAWSDTLPVKVQPGLAPDLLMIPMDSLSAPAITVDPATGEAIRYLSGLQLHRTGAIRPLPILAGSPSQHGRGIIPEPVHRDQNRKHQRPTLYPEQEYPLYRWAMAIDLELCTGCGACAAACYVENSVPLVGAEEHLRGREMSWLRIEPFYDQNGRVEFIPMLCQHCGFAPCEPVCPVYAAYHNPEGLNVQVYNRCVGTRYCSNNCPYKVRRFNWWQHDWKPPLDKLHNPDLAPRSKGMMEKCTFCIQRIRIAQDRAKDEKRPIRDGEVKPACAQSCPAGAIVFGNLLDNQSRIYRLAHHQRAYRVFAELGTECAVYYLAPGNRHLTPEKINWPS